MPHALLLAPCLLRREVMSEFAPPTSGIYPGQELSAAEEPPAAVDDGKPLTAQQRLAALKAKLSVARKTNHSAVVEEDRRNKLGTAGLKEEAKQKRYEQIAKDGKKMDDAQKLMSPHLPAAAVGNEPCPLLIKSRGVAAFS